VLATLRFAPVVTAGVSLAAGTARLSNQTGGEDGHGASASLALAACLVTLVLSNLLWMSVLTSLPEKPRLGGWAAWVHLASFAVHSAVYTWSDHAPGEAAFAAAASRSMAAITLAVRASAVSNSRAACLCAQAGTAAVLAAELFVGAARDTLAVFVVGEAAIHFALAAAENAQCASRLEKVSATVVAELFHALALATEDEDSNTPRAMVIARLIASGSQMRVVHANEPALKLAGPGARERWQIALDTSPLSSARTSSASSADSQPTSTEHPSTNTCPPAFPRSAHIGAEVDIAIRRALVLLAETQMSDGRQMVHDDGAEGTLAFSAVALGTALDGAALVRIAQPMTRRAPPAPFLETVKTGSPVTSTDLSFDGYPALPKSDSRETLAQEVKRLTALRQSDGDAQRLWKHEAKNALIAALGATEEAAEALSASAGSGTDFDEAPHCVDHETRPTGALELVEEAAEEVRCALHIILDDGFARELAQGVYVPRPGPCVIAQLFNPAVPQRSRLRLTCQPESARWSEVLVDRALVQHLHRNAVCNALKYGAADAAVTTEVRLSPGRLRVHVINLPGPGHAALVARGAAAEDAVFEKGCCAISDEQRAAAVRGLVLVGSSSDEEDSSSATTAPTRARPCASAGDGAWIIRQCARALGGDCTIRFEPTRTVFTLDCPVEWAGDAPALAKTVRFPPTVGATERLADRGFHLTTGVRRMSALRAPKSRSASLSGSGSGTLTGLPPMCPASASLPSETSAGPSADAASNANAANGSDGKNAPAPGSCTASASSPPDMHDGFVPASCAPATAEPTANCTASPKVSAPNGVGASINVGETPPLRPRPPRAPATPPPWQLPADCHVVAVDDSKVQRRLLSSLLKKLGAQEGKVEILGDGAKELNSFVARAAAAIREHTDRRFLVLADESLGRVDDPVAGADTSPSIARQPSPSSASMSPGEIDGGMSGSRAIADLRASLDPKEEARVLCVVRSASDAPEEEAIFLQRAHAVVGKDAVTAHELSSALRLSWDARFATGDS